MKASQSMRLLLCVVLSLLLQRSTIAGDTLIHVSRLIDGVSDSLRTDVTLVVRDRKIASIQDGFREPGAEDRVIDLRDYTVMPGLIDLHTHLMSQHSKDSYTERFFMEQSEYALRSTVYARLTLMAGFTTVRELGD
ncbi:MAG: amidohydrolase family protein, partial [Planctomycetaceae bacterium]